MQNLLQDQDILTFIWRNEEIIINHFDIPLGTTPQHFILQLSNEAEEKDLKLYDSYKRFIYRFVRDCGQSQPQYEKILCPGKLQNYVTNPFDVSKKIFLLLIIFWNVFQTISGTKNTSSVQVILEKTNVSLADALFEESTINGLLFYRKNGFPEFSHMAKFLRVIRNWWDTFNVKTRFKGKHKWNGFMEARSLI